MVVKYSTEHLICYLDNNDRGEIYHKIGEIYHKIFEKENMKEPIAIYVDRTTMHLANRFPQPENRYKYFDEMCEIISVLYDLGD